MDPQSELIIAISVDAEEAEELEHCRIDIDNIDVYVFLNEYNQSKARIDNVNRDCETTYKMHTSRCKFASDIQSGAGNRISYNVHTHKMKKKSMY